MEHTGVGTIKLFNSFTTIESGSPRYVIQIGRSGDYLYWSGSAWIISDETYNQANDVTTFNSNCGSLSVDGEKYGQFMIIFPDTNIQCIVDELTTNMNVDIGYPTDNPYLEINAEFRSDSIQSFIESSIKSGNDEIKYIFIQDSEYYWYDESVLDFVVSDGSYDQANTVTEIQDVLPAFEGIAYSYSIRIFLHSDDSTTTPQLDILTIGYDLAGEEPDEIYLCEVVFDEFQTDADPDIQEIIIELVNDPVKYKDNIILRRERYVKTPNINGRITQKLADTSNMALDNRNREQRYKVLIGTKTYYINVPEQALAYFWDLIV
jgi:hypothetical protein